MFSIAQPISRNIVRTGICAVACVFIPAIVVASAFLLDQKIMFALLLTPAIVAAVYRLPHIALIIMSLSVMFIESLHFNLGILPRQVTWLTDVVIILIAARVFTCGRVSLGRAQDPFRVPLLVFTGLFLCSTIVNSVSFAVTLVTIRQYFKYIILYLAITGLPFSSKHIAWSMRFFFLLILIQVPIIVISFMLGVRGDYLSAGLGSGGTAPLGFLCIAGANFFLSKYLHNRRFSDMLKFAALSIVPAMSEIKFGIIILPISIFCTLLLAFSRRKKRAFATLAVAIPVVLGAAIAYSKIYPEVFEKFGSWSYWRDYANQEYEADDLQGNVYLGRAARMRVAASHATGDVATALVGVGPGETSDSFFEAGKGSLYDTIIGAASGTQFTQVLLELGIPGIIVLLWLMTRLPRGLARLYRATTASDDKALICGLFGTSVIMLIYVFYMPVLFYADPTAYLFWISAAFLSVSITEMRQRSTN